MKFPALFFFAVLFSISSISIAQEKESKPLIDAPWSFFVFTSPMGDVLRRPNIGLNGAWRNFTAGFKASLFRNAGQVFDYGLDTSEDFGNVDANGFEIGPQFGYLYPLSDTVYVMPRLAIYRSIVHYSGGHSACKGSQTGGCEFPPGVDGWVVEAMAMLHIPVIGGFHFEAGAGVSKKFLIELNAGYAW